MSTINIIQVTLEIWGAIFCWIALIIYLAAGKQKLKSEKMLEITLLFNSVLLLSDAAAYVFRGNTSTLGIIMTRVSNYMVFFLDIIILLAASLLLYYLLQEEKSEPSKKLLYAVILIAVVHSVILTVSQFYPIYYAFDSTNHYYRKNAIILSYVLHFLGLFLNFVQMFRLRSKLSKIERAAVYSTALFPTLFMIPQLFFYGLSLQNVGMTASILFLFLASMIAKTRRMARESEELSRVKIQLADQRAELSENRNKILISQIQPHFLYNSLLTIRRLIEKNQEEALESLDHFIGFLRGSVDMLEVQGLITVKKELEFVNNYLFLEKKRFGANLNILYDIQEEQFLVPPLSVQPIVENAVKHGIRKSERGKGSVKISTYREGENYIIKISDDGVGFDLEQRKENGAKHVGIKNVRQRIECLCNGELLISSQIGKGTDVNILIPFR